ncbi:MAG: lytic murein transglycosylase [Hyphomicrobiaceae bacterium]|nr:MAG: lytic murein transglycosylase [Hyphomicrobiaceae bacterium]
MPRLTRRRLLLNMASSAAPAIAASAAGAGVPLTEVAASLAVEADARAFGDFIATRLWPMASRNRISRKTFDAALANARPDPSVIMLLERQPEVDLAIWEYVALIVSAERVENGLAKLRSEEALLADLEARYGVDRHVLVAIWGMESAYGTRMGTRSVFTSLAMLAWQGGRKAEFGRIQLLAALQIADRGEINPARMLGSWAGAFGHTQFIPTTYLAHAVDHDGDGRRDLVGSHSDALASTANYLRVSGWRADAPWGFEVRLPAEPSNAVLDGRERGLSDWASYGLARTDAKPIEGSLPAALLLPSGVRGPAFLVTQNYRAVLKYNNAMAYALAIGLLSDQLKGEPPIATAWPLAERPLRLSERRELQRHLRRRGYDIGEIDGVLGERTLAAVRHWQRARRLAPDGYASIALLEELSQATPR